MLAASFFISPHDRWTLIGTDQAPTIIDARRRDVFQAADGLLPAAVWREVADMAQWAAGIDRGRTAVIACKEGHQRSQAVAAHLRAEGIDARVLTGGYAGWSQAGLPLVTKAALDRLAPMRPQPVGHAAAAEDRPRRLPVADPPLPRCASAHPLCRPAGGSGSRARERRGAVRYRGHRALA